MIDSRYMDLKDISLCIDFDQFRSDIERLPERHNYYHGRITQILQQRIDEQQIDEETRNFLETPFFISE